MSSEEARACPDETPAIERDHRLRVLVADDSGLMRRTITQILQEEGDIEVIATARDGAEAIELAERLRPDAITMDVNMPRVDGLRAVEVIMGRHPVPIVIISSYTKRGGKAAAQALHYGAVEIIEKPSQVGVSLDLDLQAAEIRGKVRAAARVRVVRTASFGMVRRPAAIEPLSSTAAARPRPRAVKPEKLFPIVAIGASTGGPAALSDMLPLLPAPFPGCILIVQHMPAGYTSDLAHSLDQRSAITVVEARHGDPIVPGVAYIAPGGCHMEFANDHIKLHAEARRNMHRPSVDVLFESLASVAPRLQVVMLSGMGDDGVHGMKRLRAAGAATMVQDEESSVVWGMPGCAVRAGCAQLQMPPERLAEYLCAAVGVAPNPILVLDEVANKPSIAERRLARSAISPGPTV
ncbi:MAG: chemotaxis-specific protein-glutamate methyltransferase CheB [Deltaproteobacteria bacterium]|nr:chemotaxis-specific protein-glutamate methyltransferase CheB [Deltaproteobacteria bacterium]MBI3387571.1 chemotaxis-specific protein-glutamate methyltransferase CheB [Deltaproteobacteria bacterium]